MILNSLPLITVMSFPKVGTEADVVAAFKPEFLAFQNPLQDVLQKLRLAVSPFLFLGHVVLQKHEAPVGMNTDRDSEFVDCGLLGNFNRK